MELRDAIEFGDQESILAITDLIHTVAALQHGDLRVFTRIVIHQCGLLGCRVGEATNPGPPRRMRRVLSDTSSSECDPSVRTSGGRCVVPRVHSQSPGVQGARAASFVHYNRFAELSGEDTVSVLPEGVPGVVENAQAQNPGTHRRRRRRVCSEGSDLGYLTVIDSSDEDAPFVVGPRVG